MKIFVFGNSVVSNDSLPIKLVPELKKFFPKIEFITADPIENWYTSEENLLILDTVLGIDKVTLFKSLMAFEKQPKLTTPHDYDLFTDLSILQKIGKLNKIIIIGIPAEGEKKTVFEQLARAIREALLFLALV